MFDCQSTKTAFNLLSISLKINFDNLIIFARKENKKMYLIYTIKCALNRIRYFSLAKKYEYCIRSKFIIKIYIIS